MEILLEQRFVLANIGLIKNYCILEDKEKYLNANSFGMNRYVNNKKITSVDLVKRLNENRTIKFFPIIPSKSNDNDYNCFFEQAISTYTTNDEQIKKYYNNPFAKIHVCILERSIIKRGNKVTIKVSNYNKSRDYNHRYFRTNTEKLIFTFDFDSGNFQVISFNGGKKPRGVFRTNSFLRLKHALKFNPSIFKLDTYDSLDKPGHKYHEDYEKAINDNEYKRVIAKVFGLESCQLTPKNKYSVFYERIFELFVKNKKIGIPDHSYEHFITHHYPTERFLKKNNRKLISAVLDRYKIKSKLLVKIFHKYPYLEMSAMVKLCIMLGDNHTKYIGSLPDELFSISQNTGPDDSLNEGFYNDFKSRIINFDIKEVEKENLIRLLSDKKNLKSLTSHYLDEIYDHFNMIDKVRKYDNDLIFRAKSYSEFRDEHLQLSKMINAIKKGWVIQYIFEDKTVREIEAPIDYDANGRVIFYPHILKREEEYVEEGSFMHHCVASYVDHDKSIIVSIRNKDASDRITCEFNIQTGKMIQARHFCNRQVPQEFINALEIVQDKIRLHARYGTLNWKEKKKVPYIINGIEVKQEGPRTPPDLLPWLQPVQF